MEDVVSRLTRWFDGKELELEVEAELRFHMESLCQDHLERGLSWDEAQTASVKRFGNIEQVKRECVAISRRRRSLMRVLKFFFTILFLAGVIVRVFSAELQVTHLGDVLMMVAISGRLFLYVRSLGPARFPSNDKTSSPLQLNESSNMPVAPYDDQKRTPTERLISE